MLTRDHVFRVGDMLAAWRDRFLARVVIVDDESSCWEWTGSALRGYGRLGRFYAHRMAWEMANNRPVPSGLEVMHGCDNPGCVRPDHLSVGTHAQNMAGVAERSRGHGPGLYGEQHPACKLSDTQVAEIRELAVSGLSQHKIARRFGVSQTHVGSIIRRESRTVAVAMPTGPVATC